MHAKMQAVKQSSNKFLYFLLAVTVLITLWTAMSDETQSDSQNESTMTLVQPAKANINENKITQSDKNPQPSNKTSEPKDAIENEETVTFPWAALERANSAEITQDVFKPHSWLVVVPPPPPAPEPPPEPPPPPTAPPAPFQYIGKMENSPNAGKVFLMQNKQFYYVAVGENINQEWRLDKEETNVLRLTYLPLDLPQVLIKSAKRKVAVSQDAASEPINETNY